MQASKKVIDLRRILKMELAKRGRRGRTRREKRKTARREGCWRGRREDDGYPVAFVFGGKRKKGARKGRKVTGKGERGRKARICVIS